MTEKYCNDCYFMYYVDEETGEMACSNGNAIPENDGVPEAIVGEPHDCPFYEPIQKQKDGGKMNE